MQACIMRFYLVMLSRPESSESELGPEDYVHWLQLACDAQDLK